MMIREKLEKLFINTFIAVTDGLKTSRFNVQANIVKILKDLYNELCSEFDVEANIEFLMASSSQSNLFDFEEDSAPKESTTDVIMAPNLLNVSQAPQAPRAVLISRQNSHPFQERRLLVDNPAKIGRAVAKCKPSNDNAIFDCKVLSRNHALLWYESGKDTRSSNGTFVNSHRLSNANEESGPKEVFSGDIVQFGVDVIENSRKVTHGCIVAGLKLFLPDGNEAKPNIYNEDFHSLYPTGSYMFSGPIGSHNLATISTQNLYQLAQCLREALDREQHLENKLDELKRILSNAQEASKVSWKSLVEEDRLLSRIESLQTKLESVLSSNSTEPEETVTNLRNELLKHHDDKQMYESVAKDAIKKALEEKLEAYSKIHELEIALTSSEKESERLQELCESLEKDVNSFTEKHDKNLKELEEMTSKVKETEELSASIDEKVKQEKNNFQDKLSEWESRESELQALINELKLKNEGNNSQIELLKGQLEAVNQKLASEKDQQSNCSLNEQLNDTSQQLEESRRHVKELKEVVDRLDQQLKLKNNGTLNHEETSDETLLTNGVVKAVSYLRDFDGISEASGDSSDTSQLKSEIELLKELLAEARTARRAADDKFAAVAIDMDTSRGVAINAGPGEELLTVDSLRSQLKSLGEQLEEAQAEVQSLSGRLSSSEKTVLLRQQEAETLKNLFEQEKRVQVQLSEDIDSLKQRINSSESSHVSSESVGVASTECDMNSEINQLREECLLLSNKLQSVEKELLTAREGQHKPPPHLSSSTENGSSLNEIEAVSFLKSKLEKVCHKLREKEDKLQETTRELSSVKDKYEDTFHSQELVKGELSVVREEYELVAYQNKIASACAIVPLLVLLLAVFVAFYPTASAVTGTMES